MLNEITPQFLLMKRLRARPSPEILASYAGAIDAMETSAVAKGFLHQCLRNAAAFGLQMSLRNLPTGTIDIFRDFAERMGGPLVVVSSQGRRLLAHIGERKVGEARLLLGEPGNGRVHFHYVHVEPHALNLGVATAFHRHAQLLAKFQNAVLVPGPHLSNQGFEFWKGFCPDLVADDLRNHQHLVGQPVSLPAGAGTITSVHQNFVVAAHIDSPERVHLDRRHLIEAGMLKVAEAYADQAPEEAVAGMSMSA